MMQLGEELGRGTVGEMAARAGDPPLHHRRVAAGPEQHVIVIGLEHDRREVAEQIPDRGGRPAEVVGHPDAGSVAGLDPTASGSAASWLVGQALTRNGPSSTLPQNPSVRCSAAPISAPAGSRCPARSPPASQPAGQARGAAGVVAMLVGEHDAAHALQGQPGELRPVARSPGR